MFFWSIFNVWYEIWNHSETRAYFFPLQTRWAEQLVCINKIISHARHRQQVWSNLWKAVLILLQLVKQKMLFFRSIHASKLFIFIIQVLITSDFFIGFIWSSWNIFYLGGFLGVLIVSKITLQVNFLFLVSLGWLWVRVNIHIEALFFWDLSSEDCLQSVSFKYWLSLWKKYPFHLKT